MDTAFDQWLTVGFQRRVLVVVRTVTTLNRLLDVLTLFADDHRVQVVFTFDEDRPAILGEGVPALLHRLGVVVLPWERATGMRFDLAIAASENDDLHLIDAPLVLLPHGIGYQKYYPGGTVVAGLDPRRLVRDGKVVPTVIATTHADQAEHAGAAATRAKLVGDPCLDRMLAGAHRAAEYRDTLGARGRRLVVFASTWGPASLLGSHPELPLRLVSELPVDDAVVCAVLHPGIAAAHGSWQVNSWLTQARRAGLRVVPPEDGWQAAVTAASCVLSDEGSVALYAAALDRPLLMAGGPAPTTVPDSAAAMLRKEAPALASDQPLAGQIEEAIRRHRPGRYESVLARTSVVTGRAAELLRAEFYRLMRLPEPDGHAEFTSHSPPRVESTEPAAYVIGFQDERLLRFPVTALEHQLDHQHIAAHATRASLRQLSAAAIVFTELPTLSEENRFDDWARGSLDQWPDAHVAAARTPDRCLVTDRRGNSYALTTDSPDLDPLAAASMVYLGHGEGTTRQQIGGRTITVTIRTR